MKQLLLQIPFVVNAATIASEQPVSPIVHGGRWATVVIETQFMLMKDSDGLRTPIRMPVTVEPALPLRPIPLSIIPGSYMIVDSSRQGLEVSSGIPSSLIPRVKKGGYVMKVRRK